MSETATTTAQRQEVPLSDRPAVVLAFQLGNQLEEVDTRLGWLQDVAGCLGSSEALDEPGQGILQHIEEALRGIRDGLAEAQGLTLALREAVEG